MTITVNNILDAGLVTFGKLPDLYWSIDELNGSDMKVLRYVYNNCIRLYKELKWFPKGNDGSPRFWRGKEKMAEDCGLSYVTFRKTVRHLADLGIVTSMDGEDDDDNVHCIGLSAEYVNTIVTDRNYRLHLLVDLIGLLYDDITVDIIDTVNTHPYTSLLRNELAEHKEFEKVSYDDESEFQSNPQDKQVNKRTPITLERKSILTIPEIIKTQTYQQKLKLLKNVRTPHEKKIYEMAEYYEFKCRKALHSTGFRSLGKDPKNNKNWGYYERILKLCEEQGWNYKLYIDSQFDRCHYWQRKQLYPYLNQMFSENATKYFVKYLKDYKESNSITGDVKAKAEKVKSTKQIIIDQVIKDCESVSLYIEQASKRKVNKDFSPEQLKILYISDHWMGLSAYYLADIPWFVSYLNSFPEEAVITTLKNDILAIQKSKSLMKTTDSIVEAVESQMGVPKTMCV